MAAATGGMFGLLTLFWLVLTSLLHVVTTKESHSHLRHGRRKLQARQFVLWSPQQIHDTLLQWQTAYPNLVRIKTAQQAYGLPTAGEESDCPYDSGIGCLNYILTIQDYLVHAEGSTSSNALPEVLLSGELHGNERVGPTAVMETALLLLEATSCEASFEYDPSAHASCAATLQAEYGISKRQRQWLARLVATRRIVIVPTANALGYYQDTRTEGGIDVNRDFPFDYEDPALCMRTIAGRTLNEVFREHLFQMALTFHGGIEMIGYEWGADSFANSLSPDDEAQEQIASAYSSFGGGWNGTDPYRFGPMDQIIYTVKGGMEDWAYAGSWLPDKVVQCEPTTFGGYATDRTVYNDGMLRAFNMLIETSIPKTPSPSSLGTTQDVLSKDTSGNGHVSRNVRLSLLAMDLVEPYLSFVGVNDVALVTDVLPLTMRNCMRVNAVKVPESFDQVTVEWTVGGALEVDETALYFGRWTDVLLLSAVDCLTQPSESLETSLLEASMMTVANGTGYFSSSGPSPLSSISASDSPLGPVFRASIDLSSFGLGDEIFVFAKARVDQSWVNQPTEIAPLVSPQSHMVNARTNSSWYHTNNGKAIQGRQDWYSVIPLTIVLSDTTDIEDFAAIFEEDTPVATSVPTSPAPVAAQPTVASVTASPTTTAPLTPSPVTLMPIPLVVTQPPSSPAPVVTSQPTQGPGPVPTPQPTLTPTPLQTTPEVTTEPTSPPSQMSPSPVALSPTPVPTNSSPSEMPSPSSTPFPTASDGSSDKGIDRRCLAHAQCLLNGLDDFCCPTTQGVFLDCCDLAVTDGSPPTSDYAPTPPSTQATNAPTPGAQTAPPTLLPSLLSTEEPTIFFRSDVPSGAPSFPLSEAPSVEPTAFPTDKVSASPTERTTSLLSQDPSVSPSREPSPAPTAQPSPVQTAFSSQSLTLTPKNYSGCLRVHGNGGGDDDGLLLATCNKFDVNEHFKFVGKTIQLVMDNAKCLQAGRGGTPMNGSYLRVYPCDPSSSLQQFTWEEPDGAIKLIGTNLAIVFRGTTANVNEDPIILGDLSIPSVASRKEWRALY